MTEAMILKRIQARLSAISIDATEARNHADPTSDDVADRLATIEDNIAIVRDRIGDLLYARAQKVPQTQQQKCDATLDPPCSCSPDSGAVEAGTHEPGCDSLSPWRCSLPAGHIGEHRHGITRSWTSPPPPTTTCASTSRADIYAPDTSRCTLPAGHPGQHWDGQDRTWV